MDCKTQTLCVICNQAVETIDHILLGSAVFSVARLGIAGSGS